MAVSHYLSHSKGAAHPFSMKFEAPLSEWDASISVSVCLCFSKARQNSPPNHNTSAVSGQFNLILWVHCLA